MKMYVYHTSQIMNLSTKERFEIKVSFKSLRRHRKNLRSIVCPRPFEIEMVSIYRFRSTKTMTAHFELMSFPVFEEFMRVMFTPEDPDRLLKESLVQLGASEEDIEKLIKNEKFVASAKSYFTGITCDGERALRTMLHLYRCAKKALEDENADFSGGMSKIMSIINGTEID